MWTHLGARNLIALQQVAAIKQLDREIAEDWANGYGPDVDEKLERRLELKRQIDQQHAA
jgi:hypothetical protein